MRPGIMQDTLAEAKRIDAENVEEPPQLNRKQRRALAASVRRARKPRKNRSAKAEWSAK